MFRKTRPSQGDLLTNHEQVLDPTRRERLLDPNAWHNLFYEHVVCAIDEEVFEPLFHGSRGRPNASIRTLLGMLVLKEGRGWSDEELFESCALDLRIMRALGLTNFTESVPVPATFYEFKRRWFEHEIQHGVDLMEQAFANVTRKQASKFDVKADWIRMDSTLIGSNIANCCRLQLVVGCLQVFWKSLTEEQRARATQKDRGVLDAFLECKPHPFVYRLKEEEKPKKLEELGYVISRLLKIYSETDSDRWGPLSRLFSENYRPRRKRVLLRDASKIPADSIQSPYDTDATFRRKHRRQTQGYTLNVTETCNPKGLNLVTDVQVAKATKSDTKFVVSAIENTQVLAGNVAEASMDGAYMSSPNSQWATENETTLHYGGMQGRKCRYEYERIQDSVTVTDKQTGEIQQAIRLRSERYRVRFADNRPHYFDDEKIDASEVRRRIEEMPDEIRHRRNNVEGTIFHFVCRLRNRKTRYRGSFAHRLWGTCRALWINLVRIDSYKQATA
jgi:hypothetical protein